MSTEAATAIPGAAPSASTTIEPAIIDSPMTEARSKVLDEADLDDGVAEGEEEEEEGAKEEDALFTTIEHEQEEQETQDVPQPKDVTAAPRLLQKALEVGQVKADASEEDSDKEASTQEEKKAEQEAQKQPASPEKHVHHRVSACHFALAVFESVIGRIIVVLSSLSCHILQKRSAGCGGSLRQYSCDTIAVLHSTC